MSEFQEELTAALDELFEAMDLEEEVQEEDAAEAVPHGIVRSGASQPQAQGLRHVAPLSVRL